MNVLPTSRFLTKGSCFHVAFILTATRTLVAQVSDAFSQTARTHGSSHAFREQGAASFLGEVSSWLRSANISHREIAVPQSPFPIVALGTRDDGESRDRRNGCCLHVIPTPNATSDPMPPHLCKMLTDNDIGDAGPRFPWDTIIHLHQDVWGNKTDIVKARISARVNRVKCSYARKTILKRIDKPTAMQFLERHHLWGATKAKHNYGLLDKSTGELLAVATFSPRRHVQRGTSSRPHRSHELIRYCSRRDGRVAGGITKLVAGFCRDLALAPDDLVTCIDRDWGDGGGWGGLGFEGVGVLPPLVMVVGGDGVRRYLVGAGVGPQRSNNGERTGIQGTGGDKEKARRGRPGISLALYHALDETANAQEAVDCLRSHGLYPVYDAGVERRMLLTSRSKWKARPGMPQEERESEAPPSEDRRTVRDLWTTSTPSFPSEYYSPNRGVEHLLRWAQRESEECARGRGPARDP